MRVFDEECVGRLAKQWAGRAEHERPLFAAIALDDYWLDFRAQIESYVAQLDDQDRAKIVPRFRTHFTQTYGELIVGHLLRTAGLVARYEYPLISERSTLTPDWYVGGPEPVICEVFTAGLEKTRDDDETALLELIARLSAICLPYMLTVELRNARQHDSGARKQLVRDVEDWLRGSPGVGAKREFGSLRIEVLAIGGSRVDPVYSEPLQRIVTPQSIIKNLDDKANKYGALGLPLIVAAVRHSRARISTSAVEDVVLGSLAIGARGQTITLPDGVFHKRRSLSGVIYLNPYRLPKAEVEFWPNPDATMPLPQKVQDQLASVRL